MALFAKENPELAGVISALVDIQRSEGRHEEADSNVRTAVLVYAALRNGAAAKDLSSHFFWDVYSEDPQAPVEDIGYS